jgi:hypothetical protein
MGRVVTTADSTARSATSRRSSPNKPTTLPSTPRCSQYESGTKGRDASYSGHNSFWFWGPPSESATNAIVIGNFSTADLATGYAHCELAGTVQTPPGVNNDLTGTPIHRCTGLRQP